MNEKRCGRPLVYICSRYSGNTDANAERAREYSKFAVDRGTVPIAPHLLFPQFLEEETERRTALELGLDLLRRCDEVWVFAIEDGVSDGMMTEISNAGAAGQIVRYFDSECREMLM